MTNRVASLICSVTLLAALTAGCTPKGTAGVDAPKPTTGQSQPVQTPAPASPATTRPTTAALSGLDEATHQQLVAAIQADLKARSMLLSTDLFQFVSTKGVPGGYFRLVGALAEQGVMVYGANEAGDQVKFLGRVSAGWTYYGSGYDGTTLTVSGGSALATITLRFQWDGTTFRQVGEQVVDPNGEQLAKNAALLKAGEMNSLTQGFTIKDMVHPDTNGTLAMQVVQALKLAYEKALASYQAGNLPEALRLLGWGVGKYQSYFYALFPDDPKMTRYHEGIRLSADQMVPIVNDYAFFLAESGKNAEAEPLLLQVVQHAPDRTVVYLNLGDVEWSLGKKEAAKPYYQKYLTLLGADKSQAPARVAERLK